MTWIDASVLPTTVTLGYSSPSGAPNVIDAPLGSAGNSGATLPPVEDGIGTPYVDP